MFERMYVCMYVCLCVWYLIPISIFRSDGRPLRCWPCRRRPRRTWWGSSRTRTCAPSTPAASPSCPRTFSSPAEYADHSGSSPGRKKWEGGLRVGRPLLCGVDGGTWWWWWRWWNPNVKITAWRDNTSYYTTNTTNAAMSESTKFDNNDLL